MKERKPLSTPEKERLVRRLLGGERVSALALEAGVLRKSLYEWREAYRAFGAAGLNRKRARRTLARPTNWPRRRLASPSWSGSSAANRRTWIFFEKPCGHGTKSAA